MIKIIQDSMNDQLNSEFHAAHVYLSMSAYLESIHLPGFAHWARLQAEEEVSHAI